MEPRHHPLTLETVEGLSIREECLISSCAPPLLWAEEEEMNAQNENLTATDELDSNCRLDMATVHESINADIDAREYVEGSLCGPAKNHRMSTSSEKENVSKYMNFHKTLNRGISRATENEAIVSKVRSELAEIGGDDEQERYFVIDTPDHPFTLPDFCQYPADFREFLERDLISTSTQTSLEQANRLNWWTSFAQRLRPLSTSGDGNCLLHAASLGMWAFHDTELTLRKALHGFLRQGPYREALWRRWKRQQSILNAQAGLIYSEVEWRREWNAIVSMASTTPRLRRQSIISAGNGDLYGNIYESLEEIHVLALAHVLKRPIVVVADVMLKDMNGEPLAPIPFGGVYLPIECSAGECHRSPLLLAYDGGHFSALVAMVVPSDNTTAAIPLVDSSNELLCVQFHTDPGDDDCEENIGELSYAENIDLLNKYLDVVRLDPQGNNTESTKNGLFGSLGRSVGNKFRLKLSRSNSIRNNNNSSSSEHVLCALLHTDRQLEYHDTMLKNYLETAMERFQKTNASAPRYGAGKSHFYTEADAESHSKVSTMRPVKATSNDDSTLYLGKSTFYGNPCRALNCTFYGNRAYDEYCSKCYQKLLQQASL